MPKERWWKGSYVTSEDIDNFLNELTELCKKHDLSISHEDEHGSFIIEAYSESLTEWINEASIGDTIDAKTTR